MKITNGVRLRTKIMINIIMVGIAICFGIVFSGYELYSQSVRKIYNDMGYKFGSMILSRINGDEIAFYGDKWIKDTYYDHFFELMEDVHNASGAAYTYIVVPNENGEMRYIYDSSGMEFGSTDPINENYIEETMKVFREGTKPDSYFVRVSETYGYLTSSVMPVYDSKGNIGAVLFVDISMDMIESVLSQYVKNSIFISLIILSIFIFLYMYYMSRKIVKPLNEIRDEAVSFGEEGPRLNDILDNIKTNDEIEDVARAIKNMEEDIISYIDNLQAVTAEKERIGAELNVATQIQEDMLPRIFPAFPNIPQIDLYATMDPAKEVGGDFYDYFRIDDTHIAFVMADVSGKGVPAALFMVISKTLVKNQTLLGGVNKPSEILAAVNNQLCEGNEAALFCTCWLGILNIKTGHMVCASAGHEYPAIRNSSGKFEIFKDPHGLALAAMEDMIYKDYEINLEPGDALFVYTDGVPEATNYNNELFEMDRMIEALNISPMDAPDKILPTVRAEIDKFVGDAPQFDDITMLCLHYIGE